MPVLQVLPGHVPIPSTPGASALEFVPWRLVGFLLPGTLVGSGA
jgi:hypothetical protein